MGCGPSSAANKANENGATPLYIACDKGHVDAARLLLDKGAEVDRADEDGRTPLFVACFKGHVGAARLLLDKGADVNRAVKNWTPLYVACLAGHVDVAQLLLERSTEVDRADEDGRTPLYIACEHGDVDAARLLLDNGADVGRAQKYGQTPLDIAKSQGHSSIVALLHEQDEQFCLPLHVAAGTGDVDAMTQLLDGGAAVDQTRVDGEMQLFIACQNGHVDAVRLLLDNGAEVDRAFIAPYASASSYAPYATPLFIACQKGHVEVARLLLQHGAVFAHDSSALCVGDRVEARYRGGSYYSGNISRYCGEGRYDIAYDSDDGPWERGDGEGVEARLIRRLPLSALDIAKEHGHFAVVALLKEHQAAAATSGCATS